MECVVPLWRTNEATLGVKVLPGLTSELWLFVQFNGHTMAAFPVKCMEELAFGSPPATTTSHPTPFPPPHPL